MLCTLHGDARVITDREMVFKVLEGQKQKDRAKGVQSPSEISHELDEKKGMVDKNGKDKNATPKGKLSTVKQDGVKKFNKDRSSRK